MENYEVVRVAMRQQLVAGVENWVCVLYFRLPGYVYGIVSGYAVDPQAAWDAAIYQLDNP